MPCDQILTNQVEFKAGTDPDLMTAALEELGYNVYQYQGGIGFTHTGNYRLGGKFINGVFTVTEGTDSDAIKRAYSTGAVKLAAKKMGWQIKIDAKNPRKMQIIKRA